MPAQVPIVFMPDQIHPQRLPLDTSPVQFLMPMPSMLTGLGLDPIHALLCTRAPHTLRPSALSPTSFPVLRPTVLQSPSPTAHTLPPHQHPPSPSHALVLDANAPTLILVPIAHTCGHARTQVHGLSPPLPCPHPHPAQAHALPCPCPHPCSCVQEPMSLNAQCPSDPPTSPRGPPSPEHPVSQFCISSSPR
jgi:hypothetical protein